MLSEVVDSWLFGSGLMERGEFASRIAAVTARDVQLLAQQYFDPERVVEGIVRGRA